MSARRCVVLAIIVGVTEGSGPCYAGEAGEEKMVGDCVGPLV